MRQLRLLIPLLFLVFSGFEAFAKVTIVSIANASNTEDLTTSAPIIYGGVAGDTSLCTLDSNQTCDNCVDNALAGDSRLIACNNERIHPALRLAITIVSDSTTGRPTITTNDTSGQTAVTLEPDSPLTSTKGTATTIIVEWSKICNALESGDTTCEPTGTTSVGTLRVGISGDSDTLLSSATDDYLAINFRVQKYMGQSGGGTSGTSIVETCDNTASIGVCSFELGAGDAKAYLKSFTANSDFPNAADIPFRWVRFLFAEGGFSSVNAGSTSIDLPIVDQTISPKRIDGLTNQTTYFFKTAVVDAAKNVGYYTSDANDTNECSAESGGECHVVTPDEVVGILSNDKNCFIATAAFGSKLAPEVKTFRAFRNAILLQNKLGRSFVSFYYEHSPYYANFIAENDTLRSVARGLLWPLAIFAKLSLDVGLLNAIGIILLGLFASTFAVVFFSRITLRGLLRIKRRHAEFTILILLFSASALLGKIDLAVAQEINPLTEQMDSDPEPSVTNSSPKTESNTETPPQPEAPYPGSTEEGFKAIGPDNKSKESPPNVPQPPPLDVERPIRTTEEGEFFYSTKLKKPVPANLDDSVKVKSTTESGEFLYDTKASPPKFSGRHGTEPPALITNQGEFYYPIEASPRSGTFSFRVGALGAPQLVNPDNGATFSDLYGSGSIPVLFVDYEWRLTERFGNLGLKLTSGILSVHANGRFKDPNRSTEVPPESFNFIAMPNQLTAIYRLRYAENQFFTPYVEGGAGYFTFLELRDDSKPPKYGGSPVSVVAGGLNILLDWIDREAIKRLDADWGINHVWLSLEYRNFIGLNPNYDFSSQVLNAGFTLEF
jgi:hypothetical protein